MVDGLIRDNDFVLPIFSGLVNQVLKLVIYSALDRRMDITRLLQPDGMPNLNGAVFASLTTMIGMRYGLESIIFAVTATYSIVIIHDTMRLKRAKEKQVDVLNRILVSIDEFRDLGSGGIRRVLQYRPLDVLGGVLLGITTAILMAG